MKRRTFLNRTAVAATGLATLSTACLRRSSDYSHEDARFLLRRNEYFERSLGKNPVTSTYLGGSGLSAWLATVDGRLRSWSAESMKSEMEYWAAFKDELEKFDVKRLSPVSRIDIQVMKAHLEFVLHNYERRHHERAVDTYVAEPFRGLDLLVQQLSPVPGSTVLLGDEKEWARVLERLSAVPKYLTVATENLTAGMKSDNIADHRVVKKSIASTGELASYFSKELPETVARLSGDRPFAAKLVADFAAPAAAAAASATEFARFLETVLAASGTKDRYAAGEEEYAWRLKNCLGVTRTPAELWELGAKEVERYEKETFEVAEKAAAGAKLKLDFSTEPAKRASTRAVMDFLSKLSPKTDEELFRWYRECGDRAIAFGRERGMFEIPADYRFEIVETPPVLRNSTDAAYYPAPAFKKGGVGHFYLTPTGNDLGKLSLHAKGYVADTAVHEGFPGHDWNYTFMNAHAKEISNVRWFTPGAIEDSSSMWSDSMATEGWGLYAEELMAEPVQGSPYGFYTAEEYLFELQGQLLRAARIRLDVGLHTGRMTFDEAIDWYSKHVNLYEMPCTRAADDKQANAMCEDAQHQITRYSNWPTQAITYSLGKEEILALRKRAQAKLGGKFSARRFHEEFMRMGPIPPGLFGDALLERL